MFRNLKFYPVIMFAIVRKYKCTLLISLVFFYLGCAITLSLLRLECADAVVTKDKQSYDFAVAYAVLVLSSPTNGPKRDTIRATWAKLAGNLLVENGEILYKWNRTWAGNIVQQDFLKLYFVVGTQGLSSKMLDELKSEGNRNNDLLFIDFEDSYKDLASKMVKALIWFHENLKQLKYVVKCDDDSFVRIDLIVRDLEAFAPDMNAAELGDYVTYKKKLPSYIGLYWGYFDGRATARLAGKWQEKDWFLCDSYLPYALGGGYVISASIVDFIAKNADFLSVYNSEDVSMGVWTAALSGINRVHDIRFDTQWTSRGCSKHMLVRHKQSPSDMFQMFTTLVQSNGERLCKTESVERHSYRYKWDAPPSLCCK